MSNVFFKSINTPTVTFLLSILAVNFSTNSINANEVDLLFRKPYCESVKIEFFSTNALNLLSIRSIIIESMEQPWLSSFHLGKLLW